MAADIKKDYLQTVGPHRFTVGGRFFPNTASAITYMTLATDGAVDDHLGWSVAFTDTGIFTVTISGVRRARLMYFLAPTLQLATAAAKVAQYGTYTKPTATADATLVIRVVDTTDASEDNISANANNSISWGAVFSGTKVRNS